MMACLPVSVDVRLSACRSSSVGRKGAMRQATRQEPRIDAFCTPELFLRYVNLR